MNLPDYLSNLLEDLTEVSVPGLGYFVREHIGAAYNDTEAKFYPPYHKIKFIAEQKADDTLTTYIATQKNISLASSKYFAEKFVNKLYEDVRGSKQLFSNLGAFQLVNNQLVFEPNKELPNDPEFYGLPAADISRLPGKVTLTPAPAAKFQPPGIKPVEEVITTIPQPDYYNEKTEEKKSSAIWVILMAAVLVLIVAAYGVYTLNPGLIRRLFSDGSHPMVHKKLPPPPPEVRRDTVKYVSAAAQKADTLMQEAPVVPAALDTLTSVHYELIIAKIAKNGGKRASAALKHFQSENIDARIANDVPGPMIKISAGVFANKNSADSLRTILLKAGKITLNSVVIKVNPQK